MKILKKMGGTVRSSCRLAEEVAIQMADSEGAPRSLCLKDYQEFSDFNAVEISARKL